MALSLVWMRDGNAPGHGALGRADRSYGMAIAKPDGLPACRRTGLAPRQTPHLGWCRDTKPGSVCETPALKSVPSLPQKESSMNSKSPGGFERFIGIDLHPGPCIQDGQTLPGGGRGERRTGGGSATAASEPRELAEMG